MTYRKALQKARQFLSQQSDTPRLEAEILLALVRQKRREELLLDDEKKIPLTEFKKFWSLIQRRAEGEPIAYITEQKEFFSLSFYVNSWVLVPRPESEILVERALQWAKRQNQSLTLCDIGAGSGCLSLALAHEYLATGSIKQLLLCDLSWQALRVAQKNQQTLLPHLPTFFVTMNQLQALSAQTKFSLILCNPPYVLPSEFSLLKPTIQKYEPTQALKPLENFSLFFNRLFKAVGQHVAKPGAFFLETNPHCIVQHKKALEGRGFQCQIFTDYSGFPRFIEAQFK